MASPRHERGFSLLEVLIALGILGFVGVGFLSALSTGARSTGITDEQLQGVTLARSYLEEIKNCPFAYSYPNSPDCPLDTITIPGQFNVAIITECSNDGTSWTPGGSCTTESLIRVTVKASRSNGKGVSALSIYKKE